MSDRQLLELAAKAAGIVLKRSRLDDPLNRDMLVEASDKHHSSLQGWNPLTDDGDALRLAVKLSLDVSFLHEAGAINQGCKLVGVDSGGPWSSCVREEEITDPYAATRRAIVRAAAAIGAPA